MTQEVRQSFRLHFNENFWWKILQFLESYYSHQDDIIRKIIAFHTWMNVLRCRDYVMSNSDLTRALEVVYAKNIIQYMFSGKPMCEIQLRHLLDLCKISATVSIETNV